MKWHLILGLAAFLLPAASCVRGKAGSGRTSPAEDTGKPIRLDAGVYNVHPRWNATGDALGFLTGFQIMGQERLRDLVVWHPGDAPRKAERITRGLSLEDFAFSPDGKWVSYQALDPLKREYEWGVIELAGKSVTPLLRGTDNPGGGTWTADGTAVGFGGAVYRHESGAWKPAGRLSYHCPVPALVPVGAARLALACIGQDENNLFQWENGNWLPFHPADGTPDFFRYFPESQQFLLVLVRAWKNENADYTLYILGKDLDLQISIRNYNHPAKILGFSQATLYFLQKSHILLPEYDTEVTYYYPTKMREETKVERRIWDVQDGRLLYSPGGDASALWVGPAAGPGRNLMSTGRIGRVQWSPAGRRVALSAQRDPRLPDSSVWVLNLPNSI